MPSAFALSALIKTKAAAPSFRVEAFAAVTVPSFLKTGFSAGILSNLTAVGSSSVSIKVISPLRSLTSTATISLANFPAVCAA
ncbi:hypothetical protein D3C85_1265990 [compost metagenome]